jgi:hypothetical protein
MTEPFDSFLYNKFPYHGQVRPENLIFNANLQEFAQKVDYICSLETGGKMAPAEAYRRIQALYKELQSSKEQLGIGDHPFQDE